MASTSTSAANNAPQNHPVTDLLQRSGLSSVLIIDDVFDSELPSVDSLESVIREFVVYLEETPAAQDEWEHVCRDIPLPRDAADISDATLALLWEQRDSTTLLKAQLDTWLAPRVSNSSSELATLQNCLENTLKLRVECLGEKERLSDTEAQVIFLDRWLGPESGPADPRELSVNKALDIYRKYTAQRGRPPLIILMSSRDVSPSDEEEFIRKAELLGGMFDFVPKEKLRNEEKIILTMAGVAMSWPLHHEVQSFQSAVAAAAELAKDDFIKSTKKLRAEDYGYVQSLSLQREGHPLGDYMLWLFSSHLSHLFRKQPVLVEHQTTLDAMNSKAFGIPSARTKLPSQQLGKIYSDAIFDDSVGIVKKHPRDHDQNDTATLSRPHLQLGDVFMREGEVISLSAEQGGQQDYPVVYLLINAACDLAFSPDDSSRPFEDDLSLILLKGTLHRLDEPLKKSQSVTTDLLTIGEATFRVVWDKKRFSTTPYSEFEAWQKGSGASQYKRIARMRQPFVLEVQHHFALNLSRIGAPVAPPLSNSVRVQLLYRGNDNTYKKVNDRQDDFASYTSYRDKKGDRVVEYRLTSDGLEYLFEQVNLLRITKREDAESLTYGNFKSLTDQKLFERLLELSDKFSPDNTGRHFPGVSSIGYVRNAKVGNAITNKSAFLWINIIDVVANEAESSNEEDPCMSDDGSETQIQ